MRRQGSHFAVSTTHPVAILMIVVAVCVFGWVSYQQLALTLMPDITYPTLTVRTEYPNSAPQEVEKLISRPLEQELGVLQNLVNQSSISKAGHSYIILEFRWGTDMNFMSQEVREKVDRVRLPREADKPLLLRYDPSLDPILRLGLHGPQSLYELRYVAEHDVEHELEAIPGVAAVRSKGGWEEEIHISLDEGKITALGLDIVEIDRLLAQNNINLPGGTLRDGQFEYLVRTVNEFEDLDEISNLVISENSEAELRLRDIGRVYRAPKDQRIITRINGKEGVEIEVFKEGDANLVTVSRLVLDRLFGLPSQQEYVEALDEQQPVDPVKHRRMTDYVSYQLPEGMQIEILSDPSEFILTSLREVRSNAVLGGLMAMVVIYAFLRSLPHTLIIGVTIPVSILATFGPMHIFDVSLNIMSLGGLALGVGMLVDNSVVVLESIFRCREEGDDLISATIRGVDEIAGAITASTFTTVAVFFPIVFVEGIAGQTFGNMALTVVFSLCASLLVALYFIPMLASRHAEREAGPTDQLPNDSPVFSVFDALAQTKAILRDGSPPIERRGVLSLQILVKTWAGLLKSAVIAVPTILACLLKGLVTLIGPLLWLLLKLLQPLGLPSRLAVYSDFERWAEYDGVGRRPTHRILWPNIMRFKGPVKLSEGIRGLTSWYEGKNVALAVAYSPILPVMLMYLFLLHCLDTLVRTLGAVVQIALVFIISILLCAFSVAALLFMPIVGPMLRLFEQVYGRIETSYRGVINASLTHRSLVVSVATLSFLGCIFALMPRLGRELIPTVRQREFSLEFSLPVGTPLDQTSAVVGMMEDRLQGPHEVERLTTTIGADPDDITAIDKGEHTAELTVRLAADTSTKRISEITEQLRWIAEDVPSASVEVSHPALFTFKTPIEVEVHEVHGDGFNTLRELSSTVERELSALSHVVDVKSFMQRGNPELQIHYDRDRLAEFGLSLNEVAERVHHKVGGNIATDLRRKVRNIDVLVRLQEEDRMGIQEIERLVINPEGQVPITLASVAEVRIGEGPSEIRRINQRRAALLTANIQDADLGTTTESIFRTLRRLDFPEGYSFLITGQKEEMERSQDSMTFALALAIFLVYVVMASQFESLLHPFVIIFTVPLGLVGVVIVLFLAGIPLSIVVFIGLIMLAGIVVNNAIVLVDYINTLRANGMVKERAIVQACNVRLRPILITTATTVLALLPMSLGLGEGAEIRAPMAITVITGLLSATILTLVVVPCLYSLVESGRSHLRAAITGKP